MEDILIHTYRFLPLTEILWDSSIRVSFDFLKSNTGNAQQLIFDFKDKATDISLPYIRGLGPYFCPHGNDSYFYIRNIRIPVYDNQPLRPLLPLATRIKKWKLKNLQIEHHNCFLSSKIYPCLVSETKLTVSLKSKQIKPDFEKKIRKIRDSFHSLTHKLKIPIMDSVFTRDKPSLEFSDVFTVIETTIDTFNELGVIEDIFDAPRFECGWLHILNKNQFLIIYGNEKPPYKLRQRVKTAIVYSFVLLTLLSRMKYLIKAEVVSKLSSLQKIELVEFIFSGLDPLLYSSEGFRSFYLPKNYQRKLFSTISGIYHYTKSFRELENMVFDVIDSWDSYELLLLLSKSNIIVSSLRKRFSKKRFDKVYPFSNKREELMFNYLLSVFFDELQKQRLDEKFIRNQNYFAAKTANHIRENLFSWKGYNHYNVKITISELRKPLPDILSALADKDLIRLIYVKETQTKRMYALNLDNSYVKSVIFNK